MGFVGARARLGLVIAGAFIARRLLFFLAGGAAFFGAGLVALMRELGYLLQMAGKGVGGGCGAAIGLGIALSGAIEGGPGIDF